MGTGTLTFSAHGKQVTAYLSNAQNKATVASLAQALRANGFTRAAIPRVTYCETVHTDIAGDPDASTDVGIFANVLVRRTSDGQLFGILIHAPTMTIFESVHKQGYRVKRDRGQAIAALYSTCAGEPYTFHDGWLQGSSLRGVLGPDEH